MEGRPEGQGLHGASNANVSTVDSSIHHDPLNERNEETWSANGEQEIVTQETAPTQLEASPELPLVNIKVIRSPSRGSISSKDVSERSLHLVGSEKPWGNSEGNLVFVQRRSSSDDSDDSKRLSLLKKTMFQKRSLTIEGQDDSDRKLKSVRLYKQERRNSAGGSSLGRKDSEEKEVSMRSSENSTSSSKRPSRDDEENLDLFFRTMYNTTKKLSLLGQIRVRREIRQLVLDTEQQEQKHERKRSKEKLEKTSSLGNTFATEEISLNDDFSAEVEDDEITSDFAEELRLELEFTASNSLEVHLISAPHDDTYHTIAYSKDNIKSSKDDLSTNSESNIFHNCSSTSKSSMRSGSLFCRICHEGGSTENFISPCCCRGSLSRVHKNCLERWLAESDSSHCELCGYKYRTKRTPKYGITSSIFAWLTSSSTGRERKNLLVDFIALVIISPIIGLSTILALQLADSLFILDSMEKLEPQQIRHDPHRTEDQSKVIIFRGGIMFQHSLEVIGTMISRLGQMGIISMVITMDMAYISWVAMRLQSHVTKWYSWYRRNCKVTLVGYPEQVVQPSTPTNSSSISVHQISF